MTKESRPSRLALSNRQVPNNLLLLLPPPPLLLLLLLALALSVVCGPVSASSYSNGSGSHSGSYDSYQGYGPDNDRNETPDYGAASQKTPPAARTTAVPPPPPSSGFVDSNGDPANLQDDATAIPFASLEQNNPAPDSIYPDSYGDYTAREDSSSSSNNISAFRTSDRSFAPNQSTASSSSSSLYKPPPIHYQFPSKQQTLQPGSLSQSQSQLQSRNGPRKVPANDFQSPRNDVMGRYLFNKRAKLQLTAMSAVLGGAFGAFVTKSTIARGVRTMFVLCSIVWAFVAWFFRNPYGELVRSLSLAFLILLRQTHRIRKQYPTYRYIIPAIIGLRRNSRSAPPYDRSQTDKDRRQVRRFPPMDPGNDDLYDDTEYDRNTRNAPPINLWRYRPQARGDPDFSMISTIVAMAFVGSISGGTVNLPLFPTWIGAIGGAGALAFGCMIVPSSPTANDAYIGDLCRLMGMRVVAMTRELWDIQQDLELIPQIGTVSSMVLDKLLILDRKHNVRDRVAALFSRVYNQILQLQSDASRQRQDDRRRRPPTRGRFRDDGEGYDDNRDRDERAPTRSQRRRDDYDSYDDRRRPPQRDEDRSGREYVGDTEYRRDADSDAEAEKAPSRSIFGRLSRGQS